MTRHTRLLPARRTLAPIALALALLSRAASASDGGISDDAPRVLQLPGGSYLFNKPAFEKVDGELKRLQALERQHKDESWGIVLVVGLSVGLLVGVPTGVLLSQALSK